jgi:murein DD-endopeptidase MepM/ murein hydrolase activator NlpD
MHAAAQPVMPADVRGQQQLAAELAALRSDLRLYQEREQRQATLLAELRQVSALQIRQIGELNQQVAELQRQLGELDANWRSAMVRFDSALKQEGQDRRASIQQVIESVSKEIAGAIRRGRPPAETVPATAAKTYKVQQGDTLSTIAKAFGVSVDALKKTNSLSTDLIRDGQVLTIPAP